MTKELKKPSKVNLYVKPQWFKDMENRILPNKILDEMLPMADFDKGFNKAYDLCMAWHEQEMRRGVLSRNELYEMICSSNLYSHAPKQSYQGGCDALDLAESIHKAQQERLSGSQD